MRWWSLKLSKRNLKVIWKENYMVKDYILIKSILPFLNPTYPTTVLSGPKIVTLFNVILQKKNVFNFNVFNEILQKKCLNY